MALRIEELAKTIDHTLLKPDATRSDVEEAEPAANIVEVGVVGLQNAFGQSVVQDNAFRDLFHHRPVARFALLQHLLGTAALMKLQNQYKPYKRTTKYLPA